MKEGVRNALIGTVVLSVLGWLTGFTIFYWVAAIWIAVEVLDD